MAIPKIPKTGVSEWWQDSTDNEKKAYCDSLKDVSNSKLCQGFYANQKTSLSEITPEGIFVDIKHKALQQIVSEFTFPEIGFQFKGRTNVNTEMGKSVDVDYEVVLDEEYAVEEFDYQNSDAGYSHMIEEIIGCLENDITSNKLFTLKTELRDSEI